ncbi:MAG: MltA domain-containing protein [Betaproteobacteria bacterium]|nr:MltA domain-containing protein [Betaproteobacteria bacterium]
MKRRHIPVRRLAELLTAAVLAVILAGCAATPRPPAPVVPAPTPAPAPAPAPELAPAPAPAAPQVATPAPAAQPPLPGASLLRPASWADLPGWREDAGVGDALAAFLISCRTLERQPAWSAVCALGREVATAQPAQVRAFFEARFLPHQIVNPDGSREGLITGYFEPVVKGSRSRRAGFSVPLYAPPDDLLTIEMGQLLPELRGMRLRGRLEGQKVVPYYSRAELGRRDAHLNGKALFWLADPLDAFFLQVQGSGRIELDDGSRTRVAYADTNGHPYQSIGRWLVDQGALRAEQASMEGIRAWARANPQRLPELLNANPSYIFFRELADQRGGPVGAQGVPLTEGRSLAVDPRHAPLGAPVFLATTWPGANGQAGRALARLMVAQDTGSAIKGAVRADFYWGSGEEAGALAGRTRQQGRMWVLLPRGYAPQ